MKRNENQELKRRVSELENRCTYLNSLLEKSKEFQNASAEAYKVLAGMIKTEARNLSHLIYVHDGETSEATLTRSFGAIKLMEGRIDELQDHNDNLTMLLKTSILGKEIQKDEVNIGIDYAIPGTDRTVFSGQHSQRKR